MSAWTCRHTDGKAAPKIVPPRLRIPYWKGLGADSEEKHEPVGDTNTAKMNSLKVLDPKRPIREADIARSAPYLGDRVFFVLGYAIFLGSIWCLFRLSYRRDMLDLFAISNPSVGDYLTVALYAIALAIFVAYFEFNLEQLAKTISQIGQFLVFLGGAAFVQFKQADNLFGTRASVVNIFALF